jgi:hypothetical protein
MEAEDEDRAAPRAGAPSTRREAALHAALAFAIAALVLFPFLPRSGIWDPYELDTADLARRIAVQKLGAAALELPGAVNGLPTLTDLKMGELPFTSMALSFKLLGLHDWTGRLPLALWALAGAAALYALLARLVSRRAALYGVIALVTMPLYFMQARTMLGDVVTMAAVTMAFAGLAGAAFDDGADRGPSPTPRIAWLVLGFAGLVAGYLSRGLLIGVASPALAVGVAWLVLRLSGVPGEDSDEDEAEPAAVRDALGGLALAIGVVALGLGLRVLFRTAPDAPLPRALGVALLKKVPTEATFDLTIRQLGHALFPWSAFLPFAFGRLFRAPVEVVGAARARETALRVALLAGAGVAFAVHALLGPYAGAVPFSGVGLLAAVAAVAVVDLERGAPPSRALAFGCALLAFVLYRDMTQIPDEAFAVFSIDKATFPKSFEGPAKTAMQLVLLAFAGVVALSWFEAEPAAGRGSPGARLRGWARARAADYVAGLRELARLFAGNLLFALIVVEAALVGLGAMMFVGRRIGWASVDRLPRELGPFGLNAWWALPLAFGAVPIVLWLARDGFRELVRATRLPRASFTLAAALLGGGTLAVWYHPALAAQLSPKEVFEAYGRLHRADEPLALLGVRTRAAAYYYGGEVASFTEPERAHEWLVERSDQRRWLVVRAEDLPRLNALHRKAHLGNLPVLDGRSSQIVLVSNQLGAGPDQGWIRSIVLDEPPVLSHPVDAAFEDQLEVLGWEVADKSGRVVDSVVPLTSYHMRTYYRVLRPITGAWKAFLHIDGFQRRYNGDHAALEGKYAMGLWQPGDIVVDDHEFQLEPNFTPGDYAVYFGFFSGDTRFRVSRGENHENRVSGGALRVR